MLEGPKHPKTTQKRGVRDTRKAYYHWLCEGCTDLCTKAKCKGQPALTQPVVMLIYVIVMLYAGVKSNLIPRCLCKKGCTGHDRHCIICQHRPPTACDNIVRPHRVRTHSSMMGPPFHETSRTIHTCRTSGMLRAWGGGLFKMIPK